MKDQRRDEVKLEALNRHEQGVLFVLPTAAVVETGNHINQVADGAARRACALKLVELLQSAARAKSGWAMHQEGWNEHFIEAVCTGTQSIPGLVDVIHDLGTGDLSILIERDTYRARVAGVEVRIWTFDQKLDAYAG